MALCFYSHIFNRAAVTFGLESANVVGYNTLNTGVPSQMLGVTFKNVTDNTGGRFRGNAEYFRCRLKGLDAAARGP